MKKILLYIWQLPQHLIGLSIIAFHKVIRSRIIKTRLAGIDYYECKHINDAGISLGDYIFMDSDRYTSRRDIAHEHGHQIQSLYLGPLYLIVIGLPSAVGNLLHRKIKFDYYKQPWEAWADKLGGVKR